MNLNLVKNKLDSTPAFVFDENTIIKNLTTLVNIKKQSACRVLYSMKALPLELVLKLTKVYLDGLSVSSLFEARLAKEILADTGTIHMTTPGLREIEFEEIAEICTHISFNSINQYYRLINNINQCSAGLRLNPKLSFVKDPRYDPCRPHSKLGIEMELIINQGVSEKIEGLHFHNVFSNTNYMSLVDTVDMLREKLGHHLSQLKWLNLGGGYLHNQINNHKPLIDLAKQLKMEYDLEIYIEPGKAVVENAGFLVTTVIDSFVSDGKRIMVLDTSVNHNPEVFEYQRKPELLEAVEEGCSCVLVGSSCLAGDVFGEYTFDGTVKVGERLVFSNVGAYSLIKANRFNGYNLPDIYSVDKENKQLLVKQSTYQDFRKQWAT